MNFSFLRHLVYTFCFIVVLVLCRVDVGSTLENPVNKEPGRITIKVQGDPLRKVLKSISHQTGYSVAIDERLTDVAVVGNYIDVTPGAFFNRVLRGNNLSIVYDDEKQKMFVHLFGEKETRYYQVFSGDQGDSELSAVHGQQHEEFITLKNDSLFKDMSGMSNAERWEIHAQQHDEYSRLQKDPDYIRDKSGQTNAERWSQHQQQHQLFLNQKSKPQAADVAGITNQEREGVHKAQNAMWEKVNSDPKSVEPLSGKSNAEIQEVHRRQSELYKKRKKQLAGVVTTTTKE